MKQDSILEESTSEKNDAANVKESDHDKTKKLHTHKKRITTQPQEQIKWMRKGTNWTTPNDFVDHDEKLHRNMPEGTLKPHRVL